MRILKVINHLKFSSEVVVAKEVLILHLIAQFEGWVGMSLFKIIELLEMTVVLFLELLPHDEHLMLKKPSK